MASRAYLVRMGPHTVDSSVIFDVDDWPLEIPLRRRRRRRRRRNGVSLDSMFLIHRLFRPLVFLLFSDTVSSTSSSTPSCSRQFCAPKTTSRGMRARTSPSSTSSVANNPLPATLSVVVHIWMDGDRAMPAVCVHQFCRVLSAGVGCRKLRSGDDAGDVGK